MKILSLIFFILFIGGCDDAPIQTVHADEPEYALEVHSENGGDILNAIFSNGNQGNRYDWENATYNFSCPHGYVLSEKITDRENLKDGKIAKEGEVGTLYGTFTDATIKCVKVAIQPKDNMKPLSGIDLPNSDGSYPDSENKDSK